MTRDVLILIIFLLFTQNNLYAFDLDMTVEDDIRKNYNSSKLVKDTHTEIVDDILPDLPVILQGGNLEAIEQDIKPQKENVDLPKIENISYSKGNVKISSGTSFDVVSMTKINDWLAKGNHIKFVTKSKIVNKKYSIPKNTVFLGKIVEVHSPQITCNGGLVVIELDRMILNGVSYPINAYIRRADDKLIFFNNIKGNRTYLKTMWNKGNWGRTLFGKMMNMTVNLGASGSTILFSPFPFTYGTICLGLNTVVSPLTAFFSKGGHVSIPAGSNFKIKLRDDVFVN